MNCKKCSARLKLTTIAGTHEIVGYYCNDCEIIYTGTSLQSKPEENFPLPLVDNQLG